MCQALLKSFFLLLIYPVVFRTLLNRMETSRFLAQTTYIVSSVWDWRTMLLPKLFVQEF
jgi:prepilin signal peptidase PulO-like enzyme (type II secretory pathway)